MNRIPQVSISLFTFLNLLLVPFAAYGEDGTKSEFDERWDLIWSVSDSLMESHIAPSSRQEMILRACRALVANDPLVDQKSFASRISKAATEEELKNVMLGIWQDSSSSKFTRNTEQKLQFDTRLINAMFSRSDGIQFSSSRDAAINDSVNENRYVGIGVAIAFHEDRCMITKAFPKGPAHLAGMKPNDLILKVDGESMDGMSFPEIIQTLRGEKGTSVSVVVRNKDSDKERTLEMVRDEVPIATVHGFTENENGDVLPKMGSEDDLKETAYLRISAIGGSTAAELKMATRMIARQPFKRLILDLRNCSAQEIHHTLMTADVLLDQATVGFVKAASSAKNQTLVTRRGAELPDIELAVLTGPQTSDLAALFTLALRQNRNAEVLGKFNPTAGFYRESVTLADNAGKLTNIPVGYLFQTKELSLSNALRDFKMTETRKTPAAIIRAIQDREIRKF